jgi:gliding motility-associated-like protein
VRWEPADLVSDPSAEDPVVIPDTRTQFIFTVYNATCWDKDTVVIDVYEVDEINIMDATGQEYDTTLFMLTGEEATLQVSGDFDTFIWHPGTGLSDSTSQSVICSPLIDILYVVTGTDRNGCKDSDTLNVVIAQQVTTIYSGFTPNGDGVNDKWVIPHSIEYGKKIEVQVFNRWGQELFHSRGYGGSVEWDGTYKGKPVPIGTYYYIITLDDGKTKPLTGTVTIIR